MKIWVKRVARGLGEHSVEFLHPSISQQRLKLEILNFARRLTTRGTIVKNDKLGEKGRRGSRDNFRELCDALYLSNG